VGCWAGGVVVVQGWDPRGGISPPPSTRAGQRPGEGGRGLGRVFFFFFWAQMKEREVWHAGSVRSSRGFYCAPFRRLLPAGFLTLS
jgi:hypothetical protein